MANIHITFHGAMGGGAPVSACVPFSSETITSSGSNQVTTISADSGDYVSVTALSDVYVSMGASPNAATDATRYLIPAGATQTFGPASRGFKVAVTDA
jgi:uncharacterized protein YcgI (DUF1989 family)